MRTPLPDFDDRPVAWLCRKVGLARFAAVATAALGAGMAVGAVGPAFASGCVAVGMVVACDRAMSLASRRGGGTGLLTGLVAAARGEGADGFWLVRHADGGTEGMTPNAFGIFSAAMARGMERVLMLGRDGAPSTNLDAGASLPFGRRRNLREAALRREAALSRLTGKPLDCTFVGVWDDREVREVPARLDLATGIVSGLVVPAMPGEMTQSYLSFGDGPEYRLERLADGRPYVVDLPGLQASLAQSAPSTAVAGRTDAQPEADLVLCGAK